MPAHIGLFHHLPGASVERMIETARATCRGYVPFDLAPTGVRFLGCGVTIACDETHLGPVRAALARQWTLWLTPQDRQLVRPHVTIQNRVPPAEAMALFEAMKLGPLPACRVAGIASW